MSTGKPRTSGRSEVKLVSGGASPVARGGAWGRFIVENDKLLAGWAFDVLMSQITGDLIELRVMPMGAPPPGGITRRMVQEIPTGAMHRRLLREMADVLERGAQGQMIPATIENEAGESSSGSVVMGESSRLELARQLTLLRDRRSSGPTPSMVKKAQDARSYVELVVRGGLSVSEWAKQRNYSAKTISNRVTRLRTAGYLTKRTDEGRDPGWNPGKPYGDETELTKAVLAAVEEA